MASSMPSDVETGSKRNSYRSLARRATKGPLDGDDPLATKDPPAPSPVTAEAVNPPISTQLSPERPFAEPTTPPPPPPSKDFSFLLRPEIYHPLSQLDLPPSFRLPPHQPTPTTPLQTLLANHKYRAAATAASLRLCTPPTPPPTELFSLIYTRLACLTLINHLAFAAEESKALQDVNSAFYRVENGKCFLPWELRILCVRLQAVGYGDEKRGVAGYYELAKEARGEIKRAGNSTAKVLWKERLRELGYSVANALIEMGDLAAAIRQLESLRPRGEGMRDEVLEGRLALLYLQLGDVEAARRCLNDNGSTGSLQQTAMLKTLLLMADSSYADAVKTFRALPQTDLVQHNLAVCLFYDGRMDETLEILDGLVERGRNFRALTFNLATVFELCSERGRERKAELVERVARGVGEGGGGERGNVDFKL